MAAGPVAFSSAPLWYLTRSTGVVSFVLLTVAAALGVAATQRAKASALWPKFATVSMHRNTSLLGLLLLVAHVVTTVTDGFVDVGWISAAVPFTSSYKRVRLGLGTLAFDLLLIVVITSLLRLRLSYRLWRRIHLAVYAAWPVSLLHFLSIGTDVQSGQLGVWIATASATVVSVALGIRVMTTRRPSAVAR